jgi:glycerate kinase
MTRMRVVFAPDKFAGTLTAMEAAEAMARGWARRAPADVLVQVPMSDGGPGFVDVLQAALGGDLHAVTVTGPYGEPTPAAVLEVGDTAYVECAQAVGLHLADPEDRDPERAHTRGLGELLGEALDTGATRIVVGLGGSGTNDGGAGMLAALGATAEGGELDAGPAGLAELTSVDVAQVRERFAGIDLVMATDVDNPLLGINGATKIYGPQKGLPDERLVVVDGWLQRFAELTDRQAGCSEGCRCGGRARLRPDAARRKSYVGRDAGLRSGEPG